LKKKEKANVVFSGKNDFFFFAFFVQESALLANCLFKFINFSVFVITEHTKRATNVTFLVRLASNSLTIVGPRFAQKMK